MACDCVGAGSGLSAAERDRVVAGQDHVISFFVHLAETARVDGEREVRGFTRCKVNALKAYELASGRLVPARLREVQLCDFITCKVGAVSQLGLDRDVLATMNGGGEAQGAV